jgi:ATP-dependent Clp protease, protease subunit
LDKLKIKEENYMNFDSKDIKKPTMETHYSEPKYNIEQAQIDDRVVHLEGQVDERQASYITQTLLHLNKLNSKPIQLYINSPGGSVLDGLAIIDVMKDIDAPVYTCVKGLAASMGAAILSQGDKRFALPNATIMLHQVSSGAHGNIQDMEVSLDFTRALNDRLLKMIAKSCNKTITQIKKDTQRDSWMFAEDALKYGIIDEIKKPSDK